MDKYCVVCMNYFNISIVCKIFATLTPGIYNILLDYNCSENLVTPKTLMHLPPNITSERPKAFCREVKSKFVRLIDRTDP